MLETDLDRALRALPAVQVHPDVEARTLRAAHAVLAAPPASGLVGWLRVLWGRGLAPALVVGTVASYLLWAVQAAGGLYR